jgi:hypothetical protein
MGSEDHAKPSITLLLQKAGRMKGVLILLLGWFVAEMTIFPLLAKKDPMKPSTTITTNQGDTSTSTTNDGRCTWKSEPLQGKCDGVKSTEESRIHSTAIDCEKTCCDKDDCVSFQFRTKEGCLFGGDTRLGAEKDGPSSWCEPRPPARWLGQWIKDKKEGTAVPGACSKKDWNPKELSGQCFGLGSKKPTLQHTPEACQDACCSSEDCSVWQWRQDAGCFFNSNSHNCQESSPLDFEKFIGKLKATGGRSYTPYAFSSDFADMDGSVVSN